LKIYLAKSVYDFLCQPFDLPGIYDFNFVKRLSNQRSQSNRTRRVTRKVISQLEFSALCEKLIAFTARDFHELKHFSASTRVTHLWSTSTALQSKVKELTFKCTDRHLDAVAVFARTGKVSHGFVLALSPRSFVLQIVDCHLAIRLCLQGPI